MGIKFNPITGNFDLVGSASSGGTLTGVADTNSIDLTVTSGTTITADLNLSASVADSNNKLVTLDIQTDGLRAQLNNSAIKAGALDLQGPVTLLDNNLGTAFTYSASAYKFTFIKYSLERNGSLRCGRILIVNDSTTPSIADSGFIELGTVGVTFLVGISSGNVELQYLTTSTGHNVAFKYSLEQWS